jgi:hypothetical protein
MILKLILYGEVSVIRKEGREKKEKHTSIDSRVHMVNRLLII